MAPSLRAALLLLSAALGILSFPPFGLSALALVAWLPWLAALRALRPGRALLLGFAHGVLLFGGTLSWLPGIFGLAAGPMIGVLAAFPAAFAALRAALDVRLERASSRVAATAVAWIGIEHFRSEWFSLAFPWITPGTALPPGLLTPWIGSGAISGLVITGAAALLESSRGMRRGGAVLLLLLSASIAWPRSPLELAPESRRRVALVQGEGLGLEALLALTRSARVPVDAIVWPELALGFDPRALPRVDAALRELLRETGAALLVVGARARDGAEGTCNAALLLGREGWLSMQPKQRLVPFVDGRRRARPEDRLAHRTALGCVSTPVCFDLDASALACDAVAVAAGAELLLAPSLDPAAWGTVQRLQHAELARHRAAELGRWVAVASGAGRTQVLDPRGERRAELPLEAPGVLVAEVEVRRAATPYARVGRWLGPLCTFLLAAQLAWLLRLGLRVRKRKPGP